MTKRRKIAPASAPSTLEEAIERIVRYVHIETGLEKLASDAKASIAEIKGAHDGFAKPLTEEMKGIVVELRNWWAVAADALTDGVKKSVELAGCTIGLRMTPPKLKSANFATEEAAAAFLAEEGLKQFVRIELALDKPAILAALRAPQTDPAHAALGEFLGRHGFSAQQREEFFIARPDAPPVETIVELQQVAA